MFYQFFGILRSRLLISSSFLFFWLFHFLSLFGSEMTRFSLPIWFYQKEADLLSFTIFLSFGLLPRIISPLWGAIIDFLNPKKTLLLSGICLIIISLIFSAIISEFISISFIFIYFLSFLMGCCSNCIHLATLATMPRIIPTHNLLKANSLMIGAESAATLFSPLIAGFIIFNWGTAWIIWIDICCFATALLSLSFIKELNLLSSNELNIKMFFDHLKLSLCDSLKYINRDKSLIFLLILIALINFIFSLSFAFFTPMILAYSTSNLIGWINAIGGIGQILGLVIAAYFLRPSQEIISIIKPIFLLGLLGPFVIGFKNSPFFWGTGYAITLALLTIINSMNHTLWQTLSPKSLQGTIFGIRRMISSSAGPLGTILAVPIFNFISLLEPASSPEDRYQLIFLISGSVISILGLLAYFLCPNKQNSSLLEGKI